MKTFDELWRDMQVRTGNYAYPMCQDRTELEHVFNLMKGCESYLEVGTAEGNSLYILGRALKSRGKIAIVDYGEERLQSLRDEVISGLKNEDYDVKEIYGDSTLHETVARVASTYDGFYPDVVMIDAAHDGQSVMSDAINYAERARKYAFFHDITIPAVAKSFAWFTQYAEQRFSASKFVNSDNFGYGILTKRF
jgi:hypothetical protein